MAPASERPRLTADAVPFAMIPEWVLFHPQLTSHAVRLYGVLMRFAGESRHCWPGLVTLAGKIGSSRSTVQRAIKELEAVGALTVSPRYSEHGDRTSNDYHLHWAPRADDAAEIPTGEQGWPTGDMGGGPPVTPGWPAGDPRTIANRTRATGTREETSSLADTAQEGDKLTLFPGLQIAVDVALPDTISVFETAEPPSPYENWALVCATLGWDPKVGTALGIKKTRELMKEVSIFDVIKCGEWLQSQPFWSQKGVDIRVVQSQMPRYMNWRATQRPARTVLSEYEETVAHLRGVYGHDD